MYPSLSVSILCNEYLSLPIYFKKKKIVRLILTDTSIIIIMTIFGAILKRKYL